MRSDETKPAPPNPTCKARRSGRPRKKIDSELVERLAEAQLTTAEIASICKCSPDTIERRFSEVLRRGRAVGTGSVKRELYVTALGSSKAKAAAMIFFLKAHAGLSDRFTVTGPDGGPIQFKDMTDEQLDAFIREQLITCGLAAQIDRAQETGGSADGAITTPPEG